MWSSSFGARTQCCTCCVLCRSLAVYQRTQYTRLREKISHLDKREKSNEWSCDAEIKIEPDSRQESHFSDTKTFLRRISLFSVRTRIAYFSGASSLPFARPFYDYLILSLCVRQRECRRAHICRAEKSSWNWMFCSPTNCGWPWLWLCVRLCARPHPLNNVRCPQTSKSVIKSMKFANKWKSIHIGRHRTWRSHCLGVGQRTQLWCDWNESEYILFTPLYSSLSSRRS